MAEAGDNNKGGNNQAGNAAGFAQKPDPRINPWRDDLAAAHLRGEVEARHYVSGQDYSVIAPVTALRRAPAHGALMDSQLLHGEHFRVYERRGAFAWGQSREDDYVGYALLEDLGPVETPTHQLCALRSFVYTDADIKSRPLMALSMGARLTVRAIQGRFAEMADGAFIIADDIAPLSQSADDPVAIARRFIGTPYLWGGRESLGLDCSGLVQIALRQCGMACPRDSDMQEAVLGKEVAAGDAGDLVFWKGHVGLLAAPDRLIHANATHMRVVEEDFAEACARIEKTDGPVRCIKRLHQNGG